ncbi:hypothetical protein [Thalassoglobus polymorphus]|uniref:Cytochrome C n=1 Tax=Thalassoglobus polymorphus TaxID=2527994 RepID=A0A517QMR9_9PLAN|nr:hypothetical protein [Thalassoglobus polymorphus]QDT32895.1 hypothetical protein Mal48_21430 [Thalassoglobus polymorphus]
MCKTLMMAASLLILLTTTAQTDQQIDKKSSSQTTENDSSAEQKEGRPVTDLRQFMRAKLAASNKILEGLATEDLDLVRDGARTLNKMSLSEKWRVNNDTMYKQFSSEFRRVTNDLEKAANNDNLDQAALKWMGATMACIECHRFVRTALVVDKNAFK